MAKPAQVHASKAAFAVPWLTISKRNISFTAMAAQQELTTLQLKEADVLTVHYMFPGAYRNTVH